jgi:hypothetical protein
MGGGAEKARGGEWDGRCVVRRGMARATYRRGKAVRAADFFPAREAPAAGNGGGEKSYR